MDLCTSGPRSPEPGRAPSSNGHLVINANMMARLGSLDLQSITSITILPGVTTIGEYAFYKCTRLTSVVLPAGVTMIEEAAFRECTRLTSVVLPASVTTIGQGVFSGCTRLTSVVLPAGVTAIGQNAFYGCTGLTSVVLPAGVTTIEAHIFLGCTSLTSVVLPASVTTIGQGAFCYCTSLTSVVLPAGVTTIGQSSFHDCTSLRLVYIMCKNEAEFATSRARMQEHFPRSAVFRSLPERVIGDIENRLTFHLSGLPIEVEADVYPTNLLGTIKGGGNRPLCIYEPNALQFNNYMVGSPYLPRIRAYIKNVLLVANRVIATENLPPLPSEMWWHIFSFLFYQKLGHQNFQLLMNSLRAPGVMSWGRNGPTFAAIEPAAVTNGVDRGG